MGYWTPSTPHILFLTGAVPSLNPWSQRAREGHVTVTRASLAHHVYSAAHTQRAHIHHTLPSRRPHTAFLSNPVHLPPHH
jgi:hypothetical protein